jgi:hypothetical protein
MITRRRPEALAWLSIIVIMSVMITLLFTGTGLAQQKGRDRPGGLEERMRLFEETAQPAPVRVDLKPTRYSRGSDSRSTNRWSVP